MNDFDDLSILDLSAKIIDENVDLRANRQIRVNRVTNELTELDDRLAMVESFSHCVAFRTDDGLTLFDASGRNTGESVTASLRHWSEEPIHTLVYTHGHVDHVGGSGAMIADGRHRGHRAPRVIGHEKVAERFARYRYTNGYNNAINARQFGHGRVSDDIRLFGDDELPFLDDDVAEVTDSFDTRTSFAVGDLDVQLFHARGETDDHAWAWIPERKAVCTGDLLTWVFPNAGNPQKVQRYPGDWAASLRQIVAREPELILPAHGLPIAGKQRIATVLSTIADTLEDLVTRVVEMMNAGRTLDEIVHTVTVSPETLALPYLQPTYDEPEFVVRNIWRLYGGWWGGDPAELKPAPASALAIEMAALAGGADALAARALELMRSGDHRLACHLIETASLAEPESHSVHEARIEIYRQRRKQETSLMAKGVFAGAVRESEAVVGPVD